MSENAEEKTPMMEKVTAEEEANNSAEKNSVPEPDSTKAETKKKKAAPKKKKTEEDEDEEEVEEEEDAGPSKVGEAMKAVGNFFMNMLKAILGFFCSVFHWMKDSTPAFLRLCVFGAIVYLLAEYWFDRPRPYSLTSFENRIRFLFRTHIWTIAPVIFAHAWSQCPQATKSAVHAKFVSEMFQPVMFFVANTFLLATHVDDECMHWVWVIIVVASFYRFKYWMTMLYCGEKWQQLYRGPLRALIVFLTLYNFYCIVGQDTGFLALVTTAEAGSQTDSGEGGYWQYASMCDMAEKMFCAVDGHTYRTRFASNYWS